MLIEASQCMRYASFLAWFFRQGLNRRPEGSSMFGIQTHLPQLAQAIRFGQFYKDKSQNQMASWYNVHGYIKFDYFTKNSIFPNHVSANGICWAAALDQALVQNNKHPNVQCGSKVFLYCLLDSKFHMNAALCRIGHETSFFHVFIYTC